MITSLLFFCFFFFMHNATSISDSEKKTYIVYLGDADGHKEEHHELLSIATGSHSKAIESIKYRYKYAFNGFSAVLTEEQANLLSEMPSVLNIFPSRRLSLFTTRSWDFLKTPLLHNGQFVPPKNLSDVIIGLIDTGIWPESKSFSDSGFGPVPSRWKGTCVNPPGIKPSQSVKCNKKIIGARFYEKGEDVIRYNSPRDDAGHGSHTASIAAGAIVEGASYLDGIANGTARGGYPNARIAVYKVCWEYSCSDDSVLAAFDDAINDGVDLLSISVGGSPLEYNVDTIAIGSFHAMRRGILVTAAAGNSGPFEGTVSNAAPWLFTIAASTIDRNIQTDDDTNSTSLNLKNNYFATSSKKNASAGNVTYNYKPAPVMTYFSSRGPNSINLDVIKPDVTAPGMQILAAWPSGFPNENGYYVNYNILSGTSMACPHVAGTVAYVKAIHPDWSPAAIKSAIMTTATTNDNTKHQISDDSGPVTPFAFGSGQIAPAMAADPGLIYDIAPPDYEAFLCRAGYNSSTLHQLIGNNNTACPRQSNSSLNYPSFSFHDLDSPRKVKRTLTNVGQPKSTYTVKVARSKLSVTVEPKKLAFTAVGQKLDYWLTIGATSSKEWLFSSVTWSDGVHHVRSPIAASSEGRFEE